MAAPKNVSDKDKKRIAELIVLGLSQARCGA
jgi:hypothetical protein